MNKESKFERKPSETPGESASDDNERVRQVSDVDTNQRAFREETLTESLGNELSPCMVDVGGILMPRRQAIILGYINPGDTC